ncbi:unnamed protein product [Urochloa humidicola]
MASAPVCSAAILLALALFASVSNASHPLTAVEAAGHAITKEKTQLRSVHNDPDKEEAKPRGPQGSAAGKIRCLASAEEEGKKTGSYWGKAKKKLHDDDDNEDSDQDSDSDHDHDSGSDHDHDSGSDSDHDHNHDHDLDHDHDSDSDHDHDHNSDSADNDNDGDDDDDDDDHNSKNERKKHAAQGRKGAPGGN